MGEVNFNLNGNYSYYQKEDSQNKPAVQENAAEKASISNETKSSDPNKVMDALSYLGAQNLVNVSGKLPVNPADYLSDEDISTIENSMTDFEEGVNVYADAIKAEFGDLISEEQVLELAAGAFALNS